MKTTSHHHVAAAALLVAIQPGPARGAGSRSAVWATSSAPISCATISAPPDARSSRCSSNSAPGVDGRQALASGRGARLRHRRRARVSARRPAAGDRQGRRGAVHPARNAPRGEERRQRQGGRARHLHRRERQAASRAERVNSSHHLKSSKPEETNMNTQVPQQHRSSITRECAAAST